MSDLHDAMTKRDKAIGTVLGGAAGGAGFFHSGGHPLVGAALGAIAGHQVGRRVGEERVEADKAKQERHTADREQAQEHRKDLISMRKKSSYEGAMFAAMADELAHIPREKVALNVAPLMGAISNIGGRVAAAAPRALTAMGDLGSHVVRGLESAGSAGLSHASPLARQAGQGLITGLNRAETMVGGAKNLNRAAGGLAVGAGALGAVGAAGAARRALAPAPTQIVVR